MSSNNNGTNETTMALALFGVFAFFFFIAIFAVATFLAFIFTCLSLAAWHRPMKLGKETILPEEARLFVYSGATGAIALPVFVLFTAALFGVPVREDWWGYIFIAEYDLGSLGIAMFEAAEAEKAKNAAALSPPPPAAPPHDAENRAARERAPFEYARWNDEDMGR